MCKFQDYLKEICISDLEAMEERGELDELAEQELDEGEADKILEHFKIYIKNFECMG